MAAQLSIGELSRRCGLSISALRFYDQCGVLAPAEVDPVSGYRWYTEDQVGRSQLIRGLRRLDVPLSAIRAFLAAPTEDRHRAIATHLDLLGRRLDEARLTAAQLHTIIEPLEVPMNALTLDARELATGLSQVLPAISRDPGHPALAGVLVEAREGSVRLVATDRYRLAIRDIVPRAGGGATFRALVGGTDLGLQAGWLSALGSVLVGMAPGGLRLAAGRDEHRLGLLAGKFPDYEAFLTVEAAAHRLVVGRAELAEALHARTGPGSAESGVLLAFEPDRLVVGAGVGAGAGAGAGVGAGAGAGAGAGPETLQAEYQGPGIRFVINPAFAMDAVNAAVGPEVAVEATETLSPIVFRSADDGTFTCMVMPIRPDGP